MKPLVIFLSTLVITAGLISTFAISDKETEVSANHMEIVFRNIGHQLLLSAKDSNSRVLSVKKIGENKYQISFQNNFAFVPDTLLNIVGRGIKKYNLPGTYIVNVNDCRKNETVFAFEINSSNGDVVPCLGRTQASGCYLIDIEFIDSKQTDKTAYFLLLIPLCFGGFYFKNRLQKNNKNELFEADKDFITIGKFKFYAEKNHLVFENKEIELSEKECKCLKIFSENINEIVERERLMKEIWEDEGVIVISRNVDVLISKLRKKLIEDHHLKIINIHGKGYKFMLD